MRVKPCFLTRRAKLRRSFPAVRAAREMLPWFSLSAHETNDRSKAAMARVLAAENPRESRGLAAVQTPRPWT